MIIGLIRNQLERIKATKKLANEMGAHPWHASVFDALYLTVGLCIVGSFYTWVAIENFENTLMYVPTWFPIIWQIADYIPFIYLGVIFLLLIDKFIILFIHIHSFILKKIMIGIQKIDIWYWRRTGKEAVVTNAFGKFNNKVGGFDSKKRKVLDYTLYCGLLIFMFLKLT